MHIKLEFKLQDLWIGAFWKKDLFTEHYCSIGYIRRYYVDLWICLLPCLPIHLTWTKKEVM